MTTTRVLFVHPSDELYGADKVLLEILKTLRPTDVSVWISDDLDYPGRALSSILDDRGVEVERAPLPVLRRAYSRPQHLPWITWRMLRTMRQLRRIRPDLIYVNTTALAPVLIPAAILRIPSVIHVHEFLTPRVRKLLGPLLGLAASIICVSNAVRNALPRHLQPRTTVIYNGFELRQEPTRPPDGKVRFLLASRWNSWKGHEPFLRAWDGLDRPDVELRILGGPPPSGSAIDVPQKVAALRRPETVQVVGETRTVAQEIRRSDVVVVPSIRPDPLPTIAVEAAGAGRMVIGTNLGGIPEIVEHGATGLVLPSDDISQWVNAMAQVTVEQAAYMGAQARTLFEQRFTAERFRRQILSVLSEVIPTHLRTF